MSDADFPIATHWPDAEYSVCGVFLQDAEGRICLQLRDDIDGINAPGMWCLFGGHLEGDESPTECAIRELNEETGLLATPAEMTPLFRFVSQDNPRARQYLFHLERPLTPQDIRVTEGAGFGFYHSGQLDALPLMPSLREILTFADRYIKIAGPRRKPTLDA